MKAFVKFVIVIAMFVLVMAAVAVITGLELNQGLRILTVVLGLGTGLTYNIHLKFNN